MSLCYETLEEAEAKLRGSVVIYDSEPYYVADLSYKDDGSKEIMVYLFPLLWNLDDKAKVISLRDPLINATKYSLGYFFDPRTKQAIFCSRKPSRQWAQGLCLSKIYFKTHDNTRYMPGEEYLRNNRHFVDMFKGKYPSFADSKKVLNLDLGVKSVPFSRVFAVGKDEMGRFDIYYRGELAAWSPDCADRVILAPSYEYLKETFEEHGVKI